MLQEFTEIIFIKYLVKYKEKTLSDWYLRILVIVVVVIVVVVEDHT